MLLPVAKRKFVVQSDPLKKPKPKGLNRSVSFVNLSQVPFLQTFHQWTFQRNVDVNTQRSQAAVGIEMMFRFAALDSRGSMRNNM